MHLLQQKTQSSFMKMGFKYVKYMIKSKNVCSNKKKVLSLQSHLKKECFYILRKDGGVVDRGGLENR